tara:strand:+ start:1241 stop:1909 length:669 start_codon:yes stop_codon:yes gene_type:complete
MITKELQKRLLSSLILIPITIFFIFQETLFFVFFLCVLFIATSYEWIKMNKKDILKIIGVVYIFFAFILAYFLREKFSLGLFILVLIICILTDLGGFIFGKFFKGPKLIKISPKKTYTGAIGSFILSLVGGLIYIKYISSSDNLYFNLSISTDVALGEMYYLLILFISLISQIGDLIISYFKRLAKVKDTGNILPGHGGILDRIDGIIFAIPASYLLFYYLS